MTHICKDCESASALAFEIVRGDPKKTVSVIKKKGKWLVKELT